MDRVGSDRSCSIGELLVILYGESDYTPRMLWQYLELKCGRFSLYEIVHDHSMTPPPVLLRRPPSAQLVEKVCEYIENGAPDGGYDKSTHAYSNDIELIGFIADWTEKVDFPEGFSSDDVALVARLQRDAVQKVSAFWRGR